MKHQQPQIPERFKQRYFSLIDDWSAFESCILSQAPKSFRVNTLKTSVTEVWDKFKSYGISFKAVPYCGDAFILENEESQRLASESVEHFSGKIYFQELVSLLPPLAVKEELENAIQPSVLDCAAAPGSKTTQLAAIMKNQGAIVANDSDFNRIKALKANVEKLGVLNTVITNSDFRRFNVSGGKEFDFIILDAPCSSEGVFRKNFKALAGWSEKHVFQYSKLQRQLILKAFDLLKHDGLMTYSTCTYAPEENEEVLEFLLAERKNARIEPVSFEGLTTSRPVREWGGRAFSEGVKDALRVWPHHNDTGGFFLARIRKV